MPTTKRSSIPSKDAAQSTHTYVKRQITVFYLQKLWSERASPTHRSTARGFGLAPYFSGGMATPSTSSSATNG
jgi:hypothetical protein